MSAIKEKRDEFLDKYPKIAAFYNFVTHPSVWRLIGLITSAVITVISGGATIPVIGLIATFSTSLISVIAKSYQIRKVEKLKLQQALVNAIHKKNQANRKLKHYENIRKILNIKDPEKSHRMKDKGGISRAVERRMFGEKGLSHKTKAFLKTLRDVGLENIAPVVLAAVTFGFDIAGVAGTTTYVGSLIFGISKITGYSAIKTFSVGSEFFTRVNAQKEQQEIEDDIDAKCNEANIPNYKKTQQLQNYFQKQIIEEEALEALAKLYEKNNTEPSASNKEELQKSFDKIKNKIEDEGLPVVVKSTFLDDAWRAVRPWGERYEVKEDFKDAIDAVVNRRDSAPLPKDSIIPSLRKSSLISRPNKTPVNSQSQKGEKRLS